MSLRPSQTTWFELLTTHDELTDTMEALAHTGAIELELHKHENRAMDLQGLDLLLRKYQSLERAYLAYWPGSDSGMSPFSGSAGEILDKALSCLYEWEEQAKPRIQQLEVVSRQATDMNLLYDFLANSEFSVTNYSLLASPGDDVSVRLFLLPSTRRLESIPETVLWNEYATSQNKFALLVGTSDDLDALTAELAIKKYTHIRFLPLPSNRGNAINHVVVKKAGMESHQRQLHKEIRDLAGQYHVAQALGEISRLNWLVKNINNLPVSENFARITGWTSCHSEQELHSALVLNGSHAILHFLDSPEGLTPPLVLKNPAWAKPFEFFSNLLGTPNKHEADPSQILAILVPLLFGYMFGDVGQGLVLFLAGVMLHKRWPVLRILIANGVSAMVFGFVFGSMFGQEDLIPALWLHPIDKPLPILALPVAAGIMIIILGMILNALESKWRGEWLQWLHVDAPIIGLYLGMVSALLFGEKISMSIIVSCLTWYLVGSVLLSGGKFVSIITAFASLIETLLQLILNSVSFIRVGAFALAHAGLSLAFNIMADSTESFILSFLILILGNIIVIVLEGLVVSIQATRLILFEFFIRFLQANGRVFKPLVNPVTRVSSPSTNSILHKLQEPL